jgi:hypothetical protein
MVHRFTTTPETAHLLTKESKKHKFFFRILTRTSHTDKVFCEVTKSGFEYINSNHIEVDYE